MNIHSVLLRIRSNITKLFLYFEVSIKQHYNTYSNHIILNVICIGIWKMNKWERINELEVQDPEDMMDFSMEDLTLTEVWGDQVAIIPYWRLEDFISGEQSNEPAPTEFVVHTRWSTKVEDMKETKLGTYLDYVMWVFIFYFQYIIKFWFNITKSNMQLTIYPICFQFYGYSYWCAYSSQPTCKTTDQIK